MSEARTLETNTERFPDRRRELLKELLRQRAESEAESFAVSYPQQRLWFLDQLEPESAVYNVPVVYRLSGPLDPGILERSLRGTVGRHEILRTVFRSEKGEPRQVVRSDVDVRIPLLDLRDLPEPEARHEAERAALVHAHRPFDLERGPLIRARVIRLGARKHWLCLCLHHLVCDAWSMEVLVGELGAIYRASSEDRASPLEELPMQYAEFAHWQHQRLRGGRLRELLSFWEEELEDVSSFSGLPEDHPRPAVQTYRGDHLEFQVPSEVVERVEELARSREATPFMVLLAAFQVVLGRNSGEERAVVGTPVANRTREEWEPLIGFFTNTLVLKTDLSGDPTFEELLEGVKRTARQAYAHQELPFELLVEELDPDRNLSQNPLFQVLFSYREGEEEKLELPGVDVEVVSRGTETAKFDLSLAFSRTEKGLLGRVEYNRDLFEAATADRIAREVDHLLRAAVQDPSRRLSSLSVLDENERRRLVEEWNRTEEPFPTDVLLHEPFEELAAARPEEEVLIFRDRRLRRAEIEEQANRLAGALRREGVGPEVPVGIFLERTPYLPVALLGVLKAGAAYLPLDPDYPPKRLAFMLEDSGAPVAVTTESLAPRLADADVKTVCVEDIPTAGSVRPAGHPSTPENLAYVIYTSGSTGRPKGVMVTHRNAMNFFTGIDRAAGAREPGTWLAVTSVSFDIALLELLWTLSRGFRVVLQEEDPGAMVGPTAVPDEAVAREIDFSLFYFASDLEGTGSERYRLLMEGARFADQNGLAAVWTPERHFHRFGGLYPNPSVTSAAVAAVTERIQIRAGSVVLPLHDPIRVAEEWSVVDNLSDGRVGMSIASGWHANDFSLAPDHYEERKDVMWRGIDELRRLWRGESVSRRGGAGNRVDLTIYPPPVQEELPLWITSARNPETFRMAGELGLGILTHMLGHSAEELEEKIALYRRAWRDHDHPGEGTVTVMLHSFVGRDLEAVRERVRGPLTGYLKSSFDLVAALGKAQDIDFDSLPEDELDALVNRAFDRFLDAAGLLGTPKKCADLVDRLKSIGVDEVGCLIDFGVPAGDVLDSLPHLAEVRSMTRRRRRRAAGPDRSLPGQIERHDVTHLQCTPSLARLLTSDPAVRQSLKPLRRVLLGGEALPVELAREMRESISGELYNVYGPTETTVWSTVHPVRRTDSRVPIGRPIANTTVYLLDRAGRLVPTGVPGELHIGGEGVTRGYRDRPAKTAEAFVPDPFSEEPGARLYRAGDLARYRADGELEFLGRLDHQVKLRGHRVELGEVESALDRHPAVRNAVVLPSGDSGHPTLVAYCVPENGSLPVSDLRTRLRERLPEFMLPSSFVSLDEIPLTANGKVDRKALPSAESARPEVDSEFKPPEGRVERLIAEVWQEILDLDEVGVDDNFFELGGNSMLIVQVRSRLLERLDANLSLVDLFQHPTIATLAESLGGSADAGADLGAAEDQARRRRQAITARRRRARRRGGRSG